MDNSYKSITFNKYYSKKYKTKHKTMKNVLGADIRSSMKERGHLHSVCKYPPPNISSSNPW